MTATPKFALADLVIEARACRVCEAHLPLGPRPVLRAKPGARLLVVGQAPGTRVHATGIPWDDPSGDRLRAWMAVGRETFYDDERVAIVPTGLCYPGRLANGGDAPPRPECAPLWHPRIVPALRQLKLTLLVGRYAHAYYLNERRGRSVTDTVAGWRDLLPRFLPLPHPSWRTRAWQRRNTWFDEELLPALQSRVRDVLELR